jgi:arsenite methyltransferase
MTEQVQSYFRRVAPEWDALREQLFGDDTRDAVLARAAPQPWMRAADIGCGTGFLAVGLAPLVAEVHCVDASPEMLDQARDHLRDCPNAHFHLADGTRLPLEDASLDLVVANMYLHHVPEPPAALCEMARVLRPGGRLVLSDMQAHEEAWMRDEMADLWLGFAPRDLMLWLERAGLHEVMVDAPGAT